MSEQLVIRLGSRPEQVISWLVWASHNKEIIASGELSDAGQLAGLAERVGKRPVIALVPASDVILKQVTLPAKPNRQVLQALPYMLEEEQAEDIEQLFLALGKVVQQDGQYHQQVAIVHRRKLEQWLDCLQLAGFTVNRMVPDAMLLPEQSLPACIALHDQWLVKQSSWQATAIDASWWSDYLQLTALPGLTSYSPWPEHIPQPHQLSEPELPLALLAAGLEQTDFSLLQGDYKPQRKHNVHLQLWRSSAVLVLACLSLYLLQLGIANWQLNREAKAVQEQSIAQYKQAFPQERIVNLSRQLQQKLSTVNGAEPQQSFLTLLAALQQQLAQVPDMNLDNLRYDAKRAELRFQARADGFQSFERLKNALEQAGFIVEQGALSNDGAKVQGTVSMRGNV